MLIRTGYLSNIIKKKFENLNPHIRNRRGLLNGVSKIYKWLFGNLDSDDEIKYDNAITLLQQNQKNIIHETSLQISLYKKLINKIKTLNKNQANFNNDLQLLSNVSMRACAPPMEAPARRRRACRSRHLFSFRGKTKACTHVLVRTQHSGDVSCELFISLELDQQKENNENDEQLQNENAGASYSSDNLEENVSVPVTTDNVLCDITNDNTLNYAPHSGHDNKDLTVEHDEKNQRLELQEVKNEILLEHVDKNMINAMQQEVKYWAEVLRRVVATIRFLGERGLGFRGTDEHFDSPHNGNYLGALELIAQFDLFLRLHIENYGNKGKGNVSYLSKTVCDEFITLMGDVLLERIKSEMKDAKYWGLIVDSTPDVSHVDHHTGISLKHELLSLFRKHDLLINDCRAQSYDNARNMSRKYQGLQAHIKELNALAFYVPCIGHSLNLVGECSRWEILMAVCKAHLQSLSTTRWSRRSDAAKDLKQNYKGIYQALVTISEDESQKADVRQEARSLAKKIDGVGKCLYDYELKQFIPLVKRSSDPLYTKENTSLNPVKILNWMVKFNMIDVFPNTSIAYRIYVTIPIGNCEAERSFSTLKRVKDLHRANMADGILSALARLKKESELFRTIDFEELIQNFIAQKCRKKF
ncbi:uncharacterized protein LOC130896567 [Diorhabda carinulata]|uniref:uncharacterized protein LOC130896567 n=1 Tax=Diorhabda carinulata TaxID=1163345 RepID=UPI0025A211C1|nr:uncharacterized protein LOC130896567 [Diorhabda carinulata]